MLHREIIQPKTHVERYEEAISQIPVYSKEWTNFNISDPSVTVLEYLSVFETLHQEKIDDIPLQVKEKLLKMAGFTPIKARPARVLLKAEGALEPFDIPQGQTFSVGNIVYEAIRSIHNENCHIKALYSYYNDTFHELYLNLIDNAGLAMKIFGDYPKLDDAIYIICDKLPLLGEEMFFYAECEDSERNPFNEKNKDLFADIIWEVYTEEGFIQIESKDSTAGFLVSGEIKFRMPRELKPVEYEQAPQKGYLIRGRLAKVSYDIPPRIKNIEGFLFEVWQRHTRSLSKSTRNGSRISVRKDLVDDKYVSIFVKEKKGGSYYKYQQAPYYEAQGRYFDLIEEGDELCYCFDKEKYGFGPERGRDSIRLLAYDETSMRNYELGQCYGFDDQYINLPFQNIVVDSFSVMLEREVDGEYVYDFLKAEHNKDGEFEYTIYPKEGKLCIKDVGEYIGAKMYLGACATNLGDKGIVRAGNVFVAPGTPSHIKFTNPYSSTGGRFRESLASVQKRFIADIETPFASVTAKDYEDLIKNAPGLLVRKVKAYKDEARNQVMITILPESIARLPKISKDYRSIIMDLINQRRILCTKVALVNPEYIPVNVSAKVYIKPHYENVEDEIVKLISEHLDYLHCDKQFGEPLRHQSIFRAIEGLPFVTYVYDLVLMPVKGKRGIVNGQDVIPPNNGLLIPGTINVEIITHYGKEKASSSLAGINNSEVFAYDGE